MFLGILLDESPEQELSVALVPENMVVLGNSQS